MSNLNSFSLTPFLVLALAASAGAQVPPKPAPNLPPFLPDVKAPVRFEGARPVLEPRVLQARPAMPPAQVREPSAVEPRPAATIDFSRLYFDEPGDGRTWVRARSYKASFDAEGATYIPFLGSQAPRNFPVSIALASASAGGAPIPLETRGVTHDADSVTIERGAVREVWKLGLDAAEQTFEIAARPAAQGDVELRLALASELALRADGDGFALDGPHGGVRIGRATAIDADGRRLDLRARIEDGGLAIGVPADFVASARYPLVVDPMYTTNLLENLPNSARNPDIAGGGGGVSGNFGAVYDYQFSQTDFDVWTQDLFFGTPISGTGLWVDYTSVSWGAPRIAHNGLLDTYLTVAWVTTASGASEVWCRARYAGSQTQFAQSLVQNSAGGNCYYPDVGGDPALSGPTYFLAVWTRDYSASDSDIHAQLLDGTGARVGGVIYLENSGSYDWYAQVSKTNGRPSNGVQTWNITWMRSPLSGDDDAYGAQVDWDGSVRTPSFVISDSFFFSESFPAPSSPLDGPPGPQHPWMVAYARSTGGVSDIHVRVMGGSTTLAQVNLSALEGVAQAEVQHWPNVDSNGQRFVVTYNETAPGGYLDAYLATLQYVGGTIQLDEGHVPIHLSVDDHYQTQIAGCTTATNRGFGLYGLAWQLYSSGQHGDAYCGAYVEPFPYESYCSGDGSHGACPCGNVGDPGAGCANSVSGGGLLTPGGVSAVGADSFALDATNLPATSSCLFFQGTSESAPGTAFGDGLRCVAGSIVRIATKTASGGAARYPEAGDLPISYRGGLASEGGARTYQVWYRNAASFCTPSTFNLTNGVRVSWLR